MTFGAKCKLQSNRVPPEGNFLAPCMNLLVQTIVCGWSCDHLLLKDIDREAKILVRIAFLRAMLSQPLSHKGCDIFPTQITQGFVFVDGIVEFYPSNNITAAVSAGKDNIGPDANLNSPETKFWCLVVAYIVSETRQRELSREVEKVFQSIGGLGIVVVDPLGARWLSPQTVDCGLCWFGIKGNAGKHIADWRECFPVSGLGRRIPEFLIFDDRTSPDWIGLNQILSKLVY